MGSFNLERSTLPGVQKLVEANRRTCLSYEEIFTIANNCRTEGERLSATQLVEHDKALLRDGTIPEWVNSIVDEMLDNPSKFKRQRRSERSEGVTTATV